MDEFQETNKKSPISAVFLAAVSLGMISLSFVFWTLVVGQYTKVDIQAAAYLEDQNLSFDDVLAARPQLSLRTREIALSQTSPEIETAAYHYAASVKAREELLPEEVSTNSSDADEGALFGHARQRRTGASVLAASAISETDLQRWELDYAYQITIPKLGIEAPVLLPSDRYWNEHEWDLLENQMQVGLSHGVVAYPHSVEPGSDGSIILAGHSSPPDTRAAKHGYGDLFASLPKLEQGDTVEMLVDGEVLLYQIEDKKIVEPTQTDILRQQDDNSIMKLITCWPVGTTDKRMVLTASLVE